jgi:hypothetical protein
MAAKIETFFRLMKKMSRKECKAKKERKTFLSVFALYLASFEKQK